VTTNNERGWYVLTPTRLRVYTGRDEKDKKSELVISKACQVVVSQISHSQVNLRAICGRFNC